MSPDPQVTFTVDTDHRTDPGELVESLAALLVGLHSHKKDTTTPASQAADDAGVLISMPQNQRR